MDNGNLIRVANLLAEGKIDEARERLDEIITGGQFVANPGMEKFKYWFRRHTAITKIRAAYLAIDGKDLITGGDRGICALIIRGTQEAEKKA